jgi:predicted nucleotidyltransferase
MATLRQRAAAYEARHAARAAEFRARIEVLAAAEELRGVELWLIGSLAWGGFGVRSDVDVVARGLPIERVCAIETAWIFALREQVELLRFEELQPSFQERVLREGVLLSARGRASLVLWGAPAQSLARSIANAWRFRFRGCRRIPPTGSEMPAGPTPDGVGASSSSIDRQALSSASEASSVRGAPESAGSPRWSRWRAEARAPPHRTPGRTPASRARSAPRCSACTGPVTMTASSGVSISP